MHFVGTSCLLAAAVSRDIQLPTGLDTGARLTIGGTLPVIAAALGVVALVLLWAVFIRKPNRRRERGQLLEKPVERSSGKEDPSNHKSSRRRRRREKHRPRNPTLAETGGLPPMGAGDSKAPPL
jgi:hypothetical protein